MWHISHTVHLGEYLFGQTAVSAKFSGVPRNFVVGWGGGSTNSVEDRGQRERGSGGSSPLVREGFWRQL